MTADETLIFGKYQIQQRLAVGGMGEVFFASQTGVAGFERPVILKNLLPELSQHEGFIQQFLDEARVVATLNHPNVVSIFEVGLWNGTYFIAMEYIRGRNFSQVNRRAWSQGQRVPPAVAAHLIRDAALGLHHAHTAVDAHGKPLQIVHRDVSPQNVMVRDDGVVKVVDFGIARAANRDSQTVTNTLKGKLAYMAPEQVEGQASALSDQYALGVVLWELCAGQRLFRADQEIELMHKVLSGKTPRLSEVVPDIPRDLEQAVAQMLQPDRALRFKDCDEVARALEAVAQRLEPEPASRVVTFLGALGPSDAPTPVKTPQATPGANFVIPFRPSAPVRARAAAQAPPPPPPRRRLSPLWPVGAAAAACLMVVTALVASRSPAAVAPQPTALAAQPEVPAPPVADPMATAAWRIVTLPAGAEVRFDGRLVGNSPVEVKGLAASPHMVRVEKAGFRHEEREVESASPGTRSELEVTLDPVRAVVRATPPAAPDLGPGFLSLSTTPWTQVTLDGEALGTTPLYRLRVRPGRHALKLVNPAKGIDRSQPIEIKAGVVTKLDLKF